MDEKTLYGLIIGWSLALITTLFTKLWDLWRDKVKNTQEDKKNLKKAVFHLSQMWLNLKDISESELDVDAYFSLMKSHLKTLNPDFDDNIQLPTEIRNLIIDTRLKNVVLRLNSYQGQLSEVVKEVATIKPIMAINLSRLGLKDKLAGDLEFPENFKHSDENQHILGLQIEKSTNNKIILQAVKKETQIVQQFLLVLSKETDESTHLETKEMISDYTNYVNSRKSGEREMEKISKLYMEFVVQSVLEMKNK